MGTTSSARISPTAYYTSEVWRRYGLSDERLSSLEGRAFHSALSPAMAVSQRLGGPTLEAFLLARHRLIDHQLRAAIDSGCVGQVVELAAGLSPRGLRFTAEYGERIVYVETDLTPMARLKAEKLGMHLDANGPHRIRPLDALAWSGPDSLSALFATLDPQIGTAVVSEGLINYFPQAGVLDLWRNIARALRTFPHGVYLSDIHCRAENTGLLVNAFTNALSVFVRGRVGLLFKDQQDARAQLLRCGFESAEVLRPSDWKVQVPDCAAKWADLVGIIRATSRTVTTRKLQPDSRSTKRPGSGKGSGKGSDTGR